MVVLALVIELLVGDPVRPWHPVALFGRLLNALVRGAPAGARGPELVYGAALVVGATAFVCGGSALLLAIVERAQPAIAVILGAGLLKTSFSLRQLEHEAVRAATLLAGAGVMAARGPLSALVSRELDGLSPRLAASAAVESLAENLSDSFVAPLFYYVLLGVPGALAYRAINTLDAMIGYHGRYEYLGRASAKLDDIANYVPARITAALLVVSAGLARADARRAAMVGFRDHAQTESPNSGWPMAVMAGALDTQLEKAGYYRLGDAVQTPDPAMIRDAIRIVRWAAVLTCGLVLAVLITIPLGR